MVQKVRNFLATPLLLIPQEWAIYLAVWIMGMGNEYKIMKETSNEEV